MDGRPSPECIGEVGAHGRFADAQSVAFVLVLLLDTLSLEDVLNGRLDELLETEEVVSRSAAHAACRPWVLPAKPTARDGERKHPAGDDPSEEQKTTLRAPPPLPKWTEAAVDLAD
jgi:hypothetical protein